MIYFVVTNKFYFIKTFLTELSLKIVFCMQYDLSLHTGDINLITLYIILSNPTPHRQQWYAHSVKYIGFLFFLVN